MYNLECRSTEQNSRTGPGFATPTRSQASPPHRRTHTLTQTLDRNAAKAPTLTKHKQTTPKRHDTQSKV